MLVVIGALSGCTGSRYAPKDSDEKMNILDKKELEITFDAIENAEIKYKTLDPLYTKVIKLKNPEGIKTLEKEYKLLKSDMELYKALLNLQKDK